MGKIKLTRDVGGKKAGEQIEVTEGAAKYLVDEGYAEPVGRKTASEKGGGAPPPERLQPPDSTSG